MKIAVFATCPPGTFSGGRYHALMIAYVLAKRGHEAYFITNNDPVFNEDLKITSPENPVNIVVTDSNFEALPTGTFDAVFVAPQMPRQPQFYKAAVRFARDAEAALFLINYESANWFNAFSPVKRPVSKWQEWEYIAKQGACIVSSTHVSDRYAREFYTDLPPNSDFAVWQPAINSAACHAVPNTGRDKLVVLFSRPTDKHKGGGDIKDLIGPELSGYTLGIVIGNPKNSQDFLNELKQKADTFGVAIQPFFGISDLQKFALLKRSAAIVFPSYFEGYGYPPMEALAADCPCIAYDLPVLKENCGDLIRYAPTGDVAALRDKLVEALDAEPPQTSLDPRVIELTDVENRGEALEVLINDYLKKSRKTCIGGGQPSENDFGLSAGSTFRVRRQSCVTAKLTSPDRLAHVRLQKPEVGTVQFFENGWTPDGWQYCLFFRPADGKSEIEFKEQSLILDLLSTSESFEIPLANFKTAPGRTPWLKNKHIKAKRIAAGGTRALLAGLVFPARAYDELYLMDQVGQFLKLETAINETGFKRLSAAGSEYYGFSSLPIDTRQFRLGLLQLIVLRDGKVVAKGRLNTEASEKNAVPLYEVGSRTGLRHRGGTSTDPISVHLSAIRQLDAAQPSGPQSTRVQRATPLQWARGIVKKVRRLVVVISQDLISLIKPSKIGDKDTVFEVQDYHFDQSTQLLALDLSGDFSGPATIEVWGGDMTFVENIDLGATTSDQERDRSQSETRLRSQVNFKADPAQGVMLRLFKNGQFIAQQVIKNLRSAPSRKLRADDCVFDPDWNILWMRGTFQTSGADVDRIEVRFEGALLGNAVFDERPGSGSNRSFRWRFESRVETALATGAKVFVKAATADGTELQIARTVEAVGDWQEKIDHDNDALTYAKSGDSIEVAAADRQMLSDAQQILRGAPAKLDAEKRVLLVIHNLNAIERPEKRRALEAIRRELNKNGAELLILHHSKMDCGCEIPEINFFDQDLVDLAKLRSNKPGLVDPAILNYSQRMLYGFTFALNRRPKPWAEIEKQTLEETTRVSATLDAIRPSLVLVWHQWNSLMLLSRALADGQALPTAVIHEGMLPGTMTIDSKGMMAESDAVGALLQPDDPDYERFLARAERVTGDIRDQQLDRKPFAGTPAALDIIRTLKAEGKRTVFYAGINDWQSGNLPADHARARQHSPNYKDTEAALSDLLEAAERLDFYVIYKPHPNLFPRPLTIRHDRLIFTREANASECIQLVDVVATLLSSLAYISLAHGVPTILMGRNTLSETGAAYELSAQNELDNCLNGAFEKTDLETRLLRYQQHVAALLKNDLFPYGGKTDFSTLSYEDAANKILRLMNQVH